jgi:hypothetical protein
MKVKLSDQAVRRIAKSLKDLYGYDYTSGEGQKRLMYDSMGVDITQKHKNPDYYEDGDYGSDPILDEDGNPTGKIRLVPSGKVVDLNNLGK